MDPSVTKKTFKRLLADHNSIRLSVDVTTNLSKGSRERCCKSEAKNKYILKNSYLTTSIKAVVAIIEIIRGFKNTTY